MLSAGMMRVAYWPYTPPTSGRQTYWSVVWKKPSGVSRPVEQIMDLKGTV